MGELAIPALFAVLMAVEYGFNLLHGGRFQSPRDSATSLMVSIPYFALIVVLPVGWGVLYALLEDVTPWHLPMAWWIWPIAIVMMDFLTYWMHRYQHALNITWIAHSVHHSSDEYTMTTGGRSSIIEPLVYSISGAYVFVLAPALIGMPLVATALGWTVKECWGFAVHTRNIDKLGPLERFIATPSFHRVHHAINPIYIGKNFGFVTNLWDRLFGTFQPELASEPPIFGTERPPSSFHPIAVAVHEARLVWRDAVATRSWRDKLRIWFMPAGWRPHDAPERVIRFARYEPPAPKALYLVGGLQLVYLVVASLHLGSTITTSTVATNLAYLAFLILATSISGDYFERSRRFVVLELLRAVGVAAMVGVTGTWFGRPLDGHAVLLVVLAGVNLLLVVAIPTRSLDSRRAA